jgi:hypothetical protein
MSKTTNKFAPGLREHAIGVVLHHERDYPSCRATVVSIAQKIGCSPPTLQECVKNAEGDSGKRAGVPTEVADKVKALECEFVSCGRPTRYCAKRLIIFAQAELGRPLKRWSHSSTITAMPGESSRFAHPADRSVHLS